MSTVIKQEVFRVGQGGHLQLLEGAAVVDHSYEQATLQPQAPQAPRPLVFRKQAGAVSRAEDITHYLQEPAMSTVSTVVKNWYAGDLYFLRLYEDEPAGSR